MSQRQGVGGRPPRGFRSNGAPPMRTLGNGCGAPSHATSESRRWRPDSISVFSRRSLGTSLAACFPWLWWPLMFLKTVGLEQHTNHRDPYGPYESKWGPIPNAGWIWSPGRVVESLSGQDSGNPHRPQVSAIFRWVNEYSDVFSQIKPIDIRYTIKYNHMHGNSIKSSFGRMILP